MQTSKKQSTVNIGRYVILGGLFIQVLSFGIFMVVTLVFYNRIRRNPTPMSTSPGIPWKKHLFVLIAASCLIMVRSIVRVVEYALGDSGYILTHEAFLYVFDGTLMFIALALFNWVHPSELIQRRRKSPADSEESAETVLQDMA
jgi:hypothetical protein